MTSKPVNSAVRFAAQRYRRRQLRSLRTCHRATGLGRQGSSGRTSLQHDKASCRRTPVIVNEDGRGGRNSTTGDQHQQTALIVHCVVGAFRIYGAASRRAMYANARDLFVSKRDNLRGRRCREGRRLRRNRRRATAVVSRNGVVIDCVCELPDLRLADRRVVDRVHENAAPRHDRNRTRRSGVNRILPGNPAIGHFRWRRGPRCYRDRQ